MKIAVAGGGIGGLEPEVGGGALRVWPSGAAALSRLLATWSRSEAIHARSFRGSLAPHILPLAGFPITSRAAQHGFR